MKRWFYGLCLAGLILGCILGRAFEQAADPGTADTVRAETPTDYFDAFFEKRLETRRLQLETLQKSGDEQGVKDLLRLCQAETACELALSARYSQSAVMITDRGVFAAVRASSLSLAERQAITLTLCRETGLGGEAVFLAVIAP